MPNDPWDDQKWKIVFILIILVLIGILSLPTPGLPSEIQDIRTVEALSACDGKEVAVTGWVQEVVQKKGRLGSNYLEIKVKLDDGMATVFSAFPIYVVNSRATFIGKVNSGRFGGFLAPDHHVVLDAVYKEW